MLRGVRGVCGVGEVSVKGGGSAWVLCALQPSPNPQPSLPPHSLDLLVEGRLARGRVA